MTTPLWRSCSRVAGPSVVAGPKEDASPLTQRDPPLSFGKRSPQYVRSRCIFPRACQCCGNMRGESGVGDFAGRLRLISERRSHCFTTTYRCITRLTLLPEHVRDGRGSLGECRGIDFRGRGFGCQTLLVAQRLGSTASECQTLCNTRQVMPQHVVKNPLQGQRLEAQMRRTPSLHIRISL